MTATGESQAPKAVPFWQHFKPGGWVWPVAIAVLLLGVIAIGKLIHQPDTDALATIAAQAAANGAAQGAATSMPPITEAPPATTPGYDFLECSHQSPTDPVPCVPVLIWPLTDGAKRFIGVQKNGIDGELNTANTRTVYEQIRAKFSTVDTCSLWLAWAPDPAGNSLLTVYPSQQKAPSGAVALVNCSPTAKTTSGTVPTEGVS